MNRINPVGIVAATVLVSVLGGVWFGAIFAQAYAKVLGRIHDPKAKMSPLYYAGPMICMLATAVTSAFLMRRLGVASLGAAVGFGSIVGSGYLGASAVNMGINPNIPRPIAYGLLSAAYFFLSSILISTTLFWFR